MITLTREQELKILQFVYDEDNYFDNGGGRVVFGLPPMAADLIGLSPFKEYVIKIALGEKGLSQNILEIDNFLTFGEEIALAEIVAAGQVVEIMEAVNTEFSSEIYDLYDNGDLDSDSLYELFLNDYDYDSDHAELYAEEVMSILSSLEDVNGHTTDNAQIGRNINGHFVAYDYGFEPEKGSDEQCSDTREYMHLENFRHTFLNLIIELGTEYAELFTTDNVNFMAAVETEFWSYVRNEEAEEEDICGYEDDEEEEREVITLEDYTNFFKNIEYKANISKALNYAIWGKEEYTYNTAAMIETYAKNQFLTRENAVETASRLYFLANVEKEVIWKNFLTDWKNISNIYNIDYN